MTSDDLQSWQRIEPILEAALDLAPNARDAYLTEACGDDQALRERVRAMLSAGEDPDSLLEQSITDLAGPLLAELERTDDADARAGIGVGAMVGPWKLVRELGHGGMGDVFLAERADGQFAQTSALKLVRRGREHDPLLVRRFVEERRILASLSHPHVAQLLDGGVMASGLPWFAMEYIAGQPLDVYCATRNLDVAQRLALMEQVVSAVAYAHSNLLVHRDLKPGNILVTDAGDVKLLDFGIAKLLDGDGPAEPGLTMSLVMTPEYAAPEQVRGEAITTATDIYALGAVLYELLTGRSAHQFTKRTAAEIERIVCETDPEPPSAAQRTSRAGDTHSSTRPGALRISSDVDTIVLMAMQKVPARRYASADALLADLRRYRLGMPLLARPDTVRYRLSKFVGRHRLGVAAAGVFALALVGGVAGVLWQARAARLEAARADRVVEFLVDLLQQADPNITQGKEFSVRELLDRGTHRLDSILVNEPAMQAELYEVMGNSYAHLGRIAQADTLHRKGLAAARRFYGRGSDEVLNQTMAVGWGLNDQGQYAAADTLLTAAIADHRAAHRPESQALSDAIDILATAKKRLDQPVVAESLYRQSLAMQIRLTGAQDTITASRLSDLGALLSAQDDRLAAADSALSAAQDNRRRAGRTMDTPFLAGESSLAMIRMKRGDLVEAERRITVAVAGFEKLESPAGINIARAVNRLALLRAMQFRLTDAVAASERALGMFRLRLPPDHPEAFTTMSLLASYQAMRGQPASALAGARAAYDGLTKKLGSRHATTLAAAQRLAVIEFDAGASRDALALADSVLRAAHEKFGRVTSTFAPALGVVAAARSATGDASGADSVFRAALGALAHSTRVDSMALPEIAQHYAAFLVAQRRGAQAVTLRRTAAALIPAGADGTAPIVVAMRVIAP